MATLITRVTKLEKQAARHARPMGSWATFWQNLRKVYGDGGIYSHEELESLDQINPSEVCAHRILTEDELREALANCVNRRLLMPDIMTR